MVEKGKEEKEKGKKRKEEQKEEKAFARKGH